MIRKTNTTYLYQHKTTWSDRNHLWAKCDVYFEFSLTANTEGEGFELYCCQPPGGHSFFPREFVQKL